MTFSKKTKKKVEKAYYMVSLTEESYLKLLWLLTNCQQIYEILEDHDYPLESIYENETKFVK